MVITANILPSAGESSFHLKTAVHFQNDCVVCTAVDAGEWELLKTLREHDEHDDLPGDVGGRGADEGGREQ